MERRAIGRILVDMGRISDADVNAALDHQRKHGGYLGEALLACGFVTEDELEFGLASQFDLPFVFPEADAIDPDAAALVTPEWALEHLALPIMRTDESLTVVVESPLSGDIVDELGARTDLAVELALASGSRIRELIRQVYARGSAAEQALSGPIELPALIDEILAVESSRFGVSVRGARSMGWWDEKGSIRRRPLAGDWTSELEKGLSVGPGRKTAGKLRAVWEAELTRAGAVLPVRVEYLADESGCEYLLSVREVESEQAERLPAVPEGIVSEVQVLARSGSARFLVTTEPEALGLDLLPRLPELLLDPTWRSIYLNAVHRPAAGEVFSVTLPSEPDRWGEELDGLRAFQFDAVTLDLSGENERWAASAVDVASVAFLLWGADQPTGPAHEAGIRWRLRITGTDGEPEWALEPVEA